MRVKKTALPTAAKYKSSSTTQLGKRKHIHLTPNAITQLEFCSAIHITTLPILVTHSWGETVSPLSRPIVYSGLLPAQDVIERAGAAGLDFWEFPTLFWWNQSDAALLGGVTLGAALSVLAATGFRSRLGG